MFDIKACLVHKKIPSCWSSRIFCFTELKLSIFISALIQMTQANTIQIKIHFLAVMVHGIDKLIKTRGKKGRKGDQITACWSHLPGS